MEIAGTKTKRKIHGTITISQNKKIWAIRSEFNVPEDSLYNIVEECARARCGDCAQGKPCDLEHRSISSLSKRAAGDVIKWITETFLPPSPNSATAEQIFIIRKLAIRLAKASKKFRTIYKPDPEGRPYAGLRRLIWKNFKVSWSKMTRRDAQRIIRGLRPMVRFYESRK